MFTTISARQIQREYRKVLEKANKSKEPIIVMSNNKPLGAIIGLDILEKLRLEQLYHEGMKDYKAGRFTSIDTEADLEKEFERIRRLSGQK